MTFIGRSLRRVGPELGPLLDELLWHLVRGRWRKAAQLRSRELTLPLKGRPPPSAVPADPAAVSTGNSSHPVSTQ